MLTCVGCILNFCSMASYCSHLWFFHHCLHRLSPPVCVLPQRSTTVSLDGVTASFFCGDGGIVPKLYVTVPVGTAVFPLRYRSYLRFFRRRIDPVHNFRRVVDRVIIRRDISGGCSLPVYYILYDSTTLECVEVRSYSVAFPCACSAFTKLFVRSKLRNDFIPTLLYTSSGQLVDVRIYSSAVYQPLTHLGIRYLELDDCMLE